MLFDGDSGIMRILCLGTLGKIKFIKLLNTNRVYFATCLLIYSISYRVFSSSRLEVFCKNGVLKEFAKCTGKNLHRSVTFGKVAYRRTATLVNRFSGIDVSLRIMQNF